MGSLANVAVVTLDSPSRSAACEQAAHFNLIRIVRLFTDALPMAFARGFSLAVVRSKVGRRPPRVSNSTMTTRNRRKSAQLGFGQFRSHHAQPG